MAAALSAVTKAPLHAAAHDTVVQTDRHAAAVISRSDHLSIVALLTTILTSIVDGLQSYCSGRRQAGDISAVTPGTGTSEAMTQSHLAGSSMCEAIRTYLTKQLRMD